MKLFSRQRRALDECFSFRAAFLDRVRMHLLKLAKALVVSEGVHRTEIQRLLVGKPEDEGITRSVVRYEVKRSMKPC